MNTRSNPLLVAAESSAPVRTLLRATLVAAMLAGALLMSACGGDEPALAPDDSSASAGSAPGSAGTSAPATGSTTGSAATAAPSGSSAGQTGASPEPFNVVVGNAVLADLTARVGGDRVSVHNLIPPGSDAHSWQSSPQDSVRIAGAQVIVSNGAELSQAVERLIENAASPSAVQVITSEGLEPQELLELPFPGEDHEEGEEEIALEGRLLIGDGETGALSVIDLESGEVHQDASDLGARAGRIYSTPSGRYAVAVSSGANTAHVFDGGIYLEEHGDHEDLVEDDLRRLDVDLSGDNPAHLYTAGEWAAIFYDGSGDVALINEHELEEDGDQYAPVVFNAGPHHGAVVPLADDLFAVTIQHPEFAQNPANYSLPVGAEVRDLDGNVLYSAEAGCPDLLGDAGNGHMAVFGCTGGALAVEAHDGDFEGWFIAAPEGSPADFRLTSIFGHTGLDHFYALGSAVGLYLVEPEEGEMEQLIPAHDGLRPIQVSISHDGELLVVVMSDGELRVYDAHDADLMASSSDILSDEVDPGFWARPHVATAPGHLFVTDSTAGKVIALEIHGDELEVVERWEISGKPTKVAFVGILGGEGGHPEHGHAHTVGDPHFWQNPRLVVHYVNQIANGLVAADPDNAQLYLDNAAAYIAELESLDDYIAQTLAGIPHERRVIVTFHDAFGYFATRYDMEVMAFVGSHAGAVSPDDIVRVLDLVNDRGLPAVFAEPQFAADALEQVARDANIAVGHIRSLPDDEYPDYLGMMRANADSLAELLR